jgi:uncharacterized membrane protein
MTQCPTCQSPVEGGVCARCGTPVAERPGPAKETGPLAENEAAALCYLFWLFTGTFFLLWPRFRRNGVVRFHAWQSILLTGAIVLAVFLLGLVLPAALLDAFFWVVQIAVPGIWLFMMERAWRRRRIVLPGIGTLANKFL